MGDVGTWDWFPVLLLAVVAIFAVVKARPDGSTQPSGIGGWLLFYFCATVLAVVLTPANTWRDIQKALTLYPMLETNAQWQLFKNWYLVSSALFSILLIYLLYILKWRQGIPSTRKTAITLIWLAGFGVPVMDFVSNQIIIGVPNTEINLALGIGLLYSVIWSLYFYRSKRVKNTYGLSLGREAGTADFGSEDARRADSRH